MLFCFSKLSAFYFVGKRGKLEYNIIRNFSIIKKHIRENGCKGTNNYLWKTQKRKSAKIHLFWWMQGNVNERSKMLKICRRGRGYARAQRVWCKRPFPKKIKFSKFQISKIAKKKPKNFFYACACVRVKDEKLCYFQTYDAIKHRNIAFKPILRPVERKIPAWWCNCPPKEN